MADVGPEDHTDLFKLKLIEKNQINKSFTQRKFQLFYTDRPRKCTDMNKESNKNGNSPGSFEFNEQ